MKFRNRILSLVLVLGMILPNLTFAAWAEEPEEPPIPDTTIVIREAEPAGKPTPEESADSTPKEELSAPETKAELKQEDQTAKTEPEQEDQTAKTKLEQVDQAAKTEPEQEDQTAKTEFEQEDQTAKTEPEQVVQTAKAELKQEDQTAKADGTDSGDPEPNGQQSGKHIAITDWAYNPMATNADYTELRFTFTSEEDQTVYEGYIGGIQLSVTSQEKLENLLTDVADSFYANQSFKLSDSTVFSERYGMTVQPIDTEKVHNEATDTHPTTDTNLCWAASASNMLQLTGWGKQAGFETEDDLFDYFEAAYTDHGSSQEHATKWFFNGVFGEQKTNEHGAVIYDDEALDTRAQERLPDSGKLGGLLTNFAEETAEKHYEIRQGDGYDALVDAAMDMTNGTATGLGIFLYNLNGGYNGGHAITLMGYIRDTIKAGIDSLKALFISDSDNNKFDKEARPDVIDSVTMVSLNDVNYNGMAVKELGNYLPDTYSILLDYTTLAPYSASVPKESKGTKNPMTDVDYSAERTEVRNPDDSLVETAAVGDKVVLSCTLKNISYVMQDVFCKPYAVMTYYVYCNGEVIKSCQVTKYLDDSIPTAQKPNTLNILTLDTLRLTEAGDYTVSYQIDGLYYDDANGKAVPITEAYTLNNSSRTNYSFRVEAAANPTRPEAEQKVPTAAADIDTALPTYSEVFVMPTKAPSKAVSKAFEVHLAAVTTVKITLEEDGTAISEDAYSVKTNADGSVTVTFSNRFIRSLIPGTHRFRVLDENRTPLAYIVLTLR